MPVQHTDENASLLLRTPIASEADGGAIHPDDAKANGNTLKLGWQVLALGGHIEPKLPTTMASMKGASANEIALGNPRSRLEVEVFLTETWDKFTPAIKRWEMVTGHPAPAPTIPDGRNGQHRLNPAFTEWLMGLEPGWITDVDITRNEQLKACGNGVVPQQAALALRILEAWKYVVQDN